MSYQYPTTSSAAGELYHHYYHHESLLPGLPDDLAQYCLSFVPPSILYSVCRSWRQLIYSPSFPPFLSLYAVFSTTDEDQIRACNSIGFCSFDPISSQWHLLPPPPCDPPPRLLFRHPSYINRDFSIQTVAVSGKLMVIAATDDRLLPALSQPLVFNPLSRKWSCGPRFSVPRRWCAAGASCGAVYMASGLGGNYCSDVARLVEKWDLDPQRRGHERRRRGTWGRVASLADEKFSVDVIEAVGWRGKLCMVNMKGFLGKDGIVYDVESDCWQMMPEGMKQGWRGPAASMDEETIYVVDEKKGLLRRYNQFRDRWVKVTQSSELIGAKQVAAAGGKVCVLCADGVRIAVVDVASPPPATLLVMNVPQGIEVVGIHILPRLTGCSSFD